MYYLTPNQIFTTSQHGVCCGCYISHYMRYRLLLWLNKWLFSAWLTAFLCPSVVGPVARYSATSHHCFDYKSGYFQPDVFLGPVCPYVLGLGCWLLLLTTLPLVMTALTIIVAIFSLMYSWVLCAPLCWLLLLATLPLVIIALTIIVLFPAWCIPGSCVSLCAGSCGSLLCYRLEYSGHLYRRYGDCFQVTT
jgi:hypothetical protein